MRRLMIGVFVGLLVGAGGAAAANRYIITSTKQIKPSVLKQLMGSRGPRGFTGAPGPAGPQGATGATGASGVVSGYQIVNYAETLSQLQNSNSAWSATEAFDVTVSCPSNTKVLGGGFDSGSVTSPGPNPYTVSATASTSGPTSDGSGWHVTGDTTPFFSQNGDAVAAPVPIRVTAICAAVG
jgi:hypothetical protein